MATATDPMATATAAEQAVDRDPASGLPLAARAAATAQSLARPDAVSVAERAWGHALLHCGDVDDAIRHLRRAVTSGRAAGSAALVAQARFKLAFAEVQRGHAQLALRELDAALPDLPEVTVALAHAQRAIVLHIVGRLDEALADFDLALTELRRHGDLLGIQRLLINRSLVLADRHRFDDGARDLTEAEELALALQRTLTVGLIANNLGTLETARGNLPAALGHLDRAERIISAHGAQVTTLLQDRANLLLSAGLLAEARAAAAQALEACLKEKRAVKQPELLLLLAQTALLGGDHAEATAYARRSLRQFLRQDRAAWAEWARLTMLRSRVEAGEHVRPSAAQLTNLVQVLGRTGWPGVALEANLVAARISRKDRAAAYWDDACRVAEQDGPAALRARGWYARTLRASLENDPGRVLDAAARGLAILDENAAAMAATDLRAHATAHRAQLVEVGLATAVRTGEPELIFEWAERARASHAHVVPVLPPKDEQLASLLIALRAAAGATSESVARQPRLRRRASLERQIRDRARQLRAAGHSLPERAVTVPELGVELGDRALIEYLEMAGEVHAVLVVDGELRLTSIASVEQLEALVSRMLFALRRLSAGPTDQAGPAERLLADAAERLDALVLRPFGEVAERSLVIVPTGPLHNLPWSVLPSRRGRSTSVAPSAELWHRATKVAPRPEPTVLVVAGPRLEASAREAEAVAAIHGVQALSGADATSGRVLESLPLADLVHIASHARLRGENPLFSEIELTDAPLVVYDLEGLLRVPRTVVLASCEGARHVVSAGDQLLGLASAFLSRGTAQLIASVLPVADVETLPLMVDLHRRLAAGSDAATALTQAQQAVAEGGDPRAAASAAGFLCIGAGVTAGLARAAGGHPPSASVGDTRAARAAG